MQLAVHQDDANILLKERNNLTESTLDKYRTAGQIAQTGLKYVISLINDSYHLGKVDRPYSVQELCILGDSMIHKLLSKVYANTEKVREKGIAMPVNIDVNEFVNGFSPELDDNNDYTFKQGDTVTITLGVQIDGYTANISHTIVIYPPGVEIEGELKPSGPLLGPEADSMIASNIANEAVVALLGLSLTPEKLSNLPLQAIGGNDKVISGKMIRNLVNSIAESFNCVVVPGSKVRRVRRFLAGQAEGIVAETDFKGVVWDESDQETNLMKRSSNNTELITQEDARKSGNISNNSSAIPSDEFIISADEVYNIDIKMTSINKFEKEVGLITLKEIDEFSGKNNQKDEFISKSTIFIRDFAITHQLKLKSSRKLLGHIDKTYSVYPFKLSHTCESFPIKFNDNIFQQLDKIKKELKTNKLGLSELNNRYLVRGKPIQTTQFLPLEIILKSANPTGRHGIDSNKPVLPGMEIPLPQLGISSLKLKSLLKHSKPVGGVSRESTTVVLNSNNQEVIRLTGGNKTVNPSWTHSNFQLNDSISQFVNQLSDLTQDSRFGIKIKEVQPLKINNEVLKIEDSMQLD